MFPRVFPFSKVRGIFSNFILLSTWGLRKSNQGVFRKATPLVSHREKFLGYLAWLVAGDPDETDF